MRIIGTIHFHPSNLLTVLWHEFVNQHQLNQFERLTLALAFAPNIRPNLLDIFFGKNQLYDRPFSEFGGITNNEFSGFIPAVQTLLFIATAAHPHYVSI